MANPGRFRLKFEIQEPVTAKNAYGEDVVTWTKVADWRGELVAKKGKEMWAAQQAGSKVSHDVVMRWYDGLDPRHRLVRADNGRVYAIEHVKPGDKYEAEMVAGVFEVQPER